MSSISSTGSTPSPASSTDPFDSVGSTSGARSVLTTTNSWTSSGPEFVTVKVTSPAGAEVVSGITANSCTLTFTVPGTEVFDVVDSPAEVSSDEHPDSTTAPATTELRTTSPSLMMAPSRRWSNQHNSPLL